MDGSAQRVGGKLDDGLGVTACVGDGNERGGVRVVGERIILGRRFPRAAGACAGGEDHQQKAGATDPGEVHGGAWGHP